MKLKVVNAAAKPASGELPVPVWVGDAGPSSFASTFASALGLEVSEWHPLKTVRAKLAAYTARDVVIQQTVMIEERVGQDRSESKLSVDAETACIALVSAVCELLADRSDAENLWAYVE